MGPEAPPVGGNAPSVIQPYDPPVRRAADAPYHMQLVAEPRMIVFAQLVAAAGIDRQQQLVILAAAHGRLYGDIGRYALRMQLGPDTRPLHYMTQIGGYAVRNQTLIYT